MKQDNVVVGVKGRENRGSFSGLLLLSCPRQTAGSCRLLIGVIWVGE